MPKDRYRLYHLERAKGGVALNMTAGSAIVAEDSPAAFGNLHAYKDEIVPWLKRLVDDCHDYDTKVMIQLTHLGRRTHWNHSDWLPVLSPSPIREAAHRAFPKQIEDWDLDRIVSAYVAAAERMQAAGMDGIELEAYGHLLDAFWSPITNQRGDEYDGSLKNRTRFTERVIRAVRTAVGAEMVIGVRMVADENRKHGLGRKQGIAIAKRLVDTGDIDFLNIIRGHIDTDAGLSKVIPVQGMPSAPHLDFAGEVRKQIQFPVFHAARIADIATARHALAEGKLDMVGMTRAHIADPHIIRKILAGEEDQIRPCVGATYCLDRIYEGNEALCIHNPATGREASMPHVISRTAKTAKTVIVIGAGVAGLEAARVLAARGHVVQLFEAADKAGGQIHLAARSNRRRELIGIVDWRLAECERLGVNINYNQYLEAEDVRAMAMDIVIVATGGWPNTEILETGNDLVHSSWDIIGANVPIAPNVLLFDDNGAHPGLQAAEVIAQSGANLEVITPERFYGPDVGGVNHARYAQSLVQHRVNITIQTRLQSVRAEGTQLVATLSSDYDASYCEERCVDQVVVEHGTLPADDLYYELKPDSTNLGATDYSALIHSQPQTLLHNKNGQFQLFRIGDAVSSRNAHAAIYDALRLGITL